MKPLRVLLFVLALASIALASMATHGSAQGGSELDVIVARDRAALTALLTPEGGRTTVCEGAACPRGVTRIVAENVQMDAHGSRGEVSAHLIVTADLPLLGESQIPTDVRCEGEPRIDDAGVLRIHETTCTVGAVPGMSDALGRAVASAVEQRSLDVMGRARSGGLSSYNDDARLAAPRAEGCVQYVALLLRWHRTQPLTALP